MVTSRHCSSDTFTLCGSVGEQKMSNLPESRLEPAPPFTFCAVDYFGPLLVKQGREEVKRYGALFICMASHGLHIEVSDSLDTDSFLQALRWFVAQRGLVREMHSDLILSVPATRSNKCTKKWMTAESRQSC